MYERAKWVYNAWNDHLSYFINFFFIYETNMLLTDKKFYMEIEQKFLLDELLNRSITDIKRLTAKEKEGAFSFSMKRRSEWELCFENDSIFVALQCKLKQEAFYTVSFRYIEKGWKNSRLDRRIICKNTKKNQGFLL